MDVFFLKISFELMPMKTCEVNRQQSVKSSQLCVLLVFDWEILVRNGSMN